MLKEMVHMDQDVTTALAVLKGSVVGGGGNGFGHHLKEGRRTYTWSYAPAPGEERAITIVGHISVNALDESLRFRDDTEVELIINDEPYLVYWSSSHEHPCRVAHVKPEGSTSWKSGLICDAQLFAWNEPAERQVA